MTPRPAALRPPFCTDVGIVRAHASFDPPAGSGGSVDFILDIFGYFD